MVHYTYALIPLFLFVTFGAQQVYAESFIGNYADGYDLGKTNGENDFKSSNEHDSKCPENDSLVWCAGYKTGYEKGWFIDG